MLNNIDSSTLEAQFSKYNRLEITDYVCYDCDKDLGDLNFSDYLKAGLPLRSDGKLVVLCSVCCLKDDY